MSCAAKKGLLFCSCSAGVCVNTRGQEVGERVSAQRTVRLGGGQKVLVRGHLRPRQKRRARGKVWLLAAKTTARPLQRDQRWARQPGEAHQGLKEQKSASVYLVLQELLGGLGAMAFRPPHLARLDA